MRVPGQAASGDPRAHLRILRHFHQPDQNQIHPTRKQRPTNPPPKPPKLRRSATGPLRAQQDLIKYAYFCEITPLESKSPIKPEYMRHLLIDGIGRSIICGSRDYLGCEVCSRIDASELAGNLRNFPKLRTVVVKYEGYRPEMQRFKESLRENTQFQLVGITNPDLSFMYKLQGPELGDVSVEFGRTLHKWIDHAVQDKIDWLQK